MRGQERSSNHAHLTRSQYPSCRWRSGDSPTAESGGTWVQAEDWEFRVILSYRLHWRPAWATWNPVWKHQKMKKEEGEEEIL